MRIAAVVVLALALAPVASGAGESVAVRSYLTPGPYFFGDQITATLDVFVPTGTEVRVDTNFTPYDRVGAAKRSELRDGDVTRIRYRYVLDCDTLACVTRGGKLERRFLFPPARIRYRDFKGHMVTRKVRWPYVRVVSRIGRTDAPTGSEASREVQFAGNPSDRMRASVVAASPSYRLDPWLLGLLLFGGALAALLGAAATGRPLLALVRRGGVDAGLELTPLERALAAVDAATAGSPEHREALAALARALRQSGSPELVRRARRLAWAEQAPTAADSRALVNDVRAET